VSNAKIGWVYFDATGHVVFTSFDGTTTVAITSPLTYIGVPVVIRARKVGSTGTLWINGAQVASLSLAGITSPALTTATVGGFNGNLLTHNGSMGWCLPIKGAETDANGLTIDRLLASNFPNGPAF
jgi:hypothetical protein